jgi:hypothetical protein
MVLIVLGLPDFQCRLRQAARDYRKHRDQNNVIKSHVDRSGLKLHAEPKSEEMWDPSEELGMKLKKTPPSDPSGDQPSPAQEHTSSSASRVYLKQLHAWQLFI